MPFAWSERGSTCVRLVHKDGSKIWYDDDMRPSAASRVPHSRGKCENQQNVVAVNCTNECDGASTVLFMFLPLLLLLLLL